MPLAYGIMQQKKKRVLNFETYCAPSDFDRTAQDVDIYDIFERYYKTNSNAKWIYSVADSFTTNYLLSAGEGPTYGGTSYRWGYELSGVSYVVDCPATTTPTAPNGTYTSITVASTAGFPDTGKINIGSLYVQGWSKKPYFTYTSKDDTHFYGPSQTVSNMGAKDVNPVIAWPTGSTKRWVITNHTSTTAIACVVTNHFGPIWLYCGNLIYTVSTSSYISQCTVKYIHIHALSNITHYTDWAHVNSPITGNLYLSGSVVNGYLGDYVPGYSEARNVFGNCTLLTGTLTIPDGVLRISSGCFAGCTGFTDLDLGNTVTTLKTQAFYGMTGCIGTLDIPESVTTIETNVFQRSGWTNVTSSSANYDATDYVLYDIQTSGKIKANYSCNGKTGSLSFRSDMTEILNYCCYYDTLKTGILTIPSTCTVIGTNAFYSCTGFNSALSLPTSIETISDYAFYGCSGFPGNLTLPDSVTTIGKYAFFGWRATGSLTLGSGLLTIGASAFQNCRFTGNLTIPDSVTSIGNLAFSGYYYGGGWAGAYNIVIGSSVTTIGSAAFSNQGFTGTLTIGNSVATISDNAFSNTPLTGTLTIPSSVTTIGVTAFVFTNFSAITSSSTNYPDSDNVLYDVKTAGQVKAIANAKSYVGTLTLRADTTSVGDYTFRDGSRTGNLTIPDTVTLLGYQAFCNMTKLTGNLTIGTGLTTIPSMCFYNTKLTGALTIPNNITSLAGQQNFDNCNFSSVSLGSGLTSIPTYCFRGNGMTGTLTLPSGITTIGAYAFQTNSFTRVDSYRTTAPTTGTSTFDSDAMALHIVSGSSGYNVAPWTTTAIFATITQDL